MWEEIDFQKASSNGGENYGWDCKEGDHPFEPSSCTPGTELKDPVYEYMHDGSDCSVQGGFVYRGSTYPNMYGKYIFVDYCSGRFRTLFRLDGEKIVAIIAEEDPFQEDPFQYGSFGEDVNGELYVADNVDGEIYKVADASEVLKETNTIVSKTNDVSLYPNPNSGEFIINWIGTSNERVSITIHNLLGQSVISEIIAATEGIIHGHHPMINSPKVRMFL